MNGEKWKTAKLSTVLKKVIDYRGKAPPKSESGVRLITARNVRFGHLDLSHAEYIDEARYEDWMNRGRPCGTDVLFTTEAPLGNACMFPADGKYAVGQRIITLRPDPAKLDSSYLLNFLLSPVGQGLIDKRSSGSTAKGIKSKEFAKIEMALPPLTEQQKVGTILATWDRAIETVEALIANTRTQKQALMQQLLPQGATPPKKRLPGFSGEWKQVALAEIGTISSAGVDKNIIEGEAEVRLLNFLDAYNREFIYDSDLNHKVTAPIAKVQGCNVRKGDVFFTPSSETRDDIALAAVAAEDMPGVVYSYHIVRFRPTKKLDLKFCAFLFQTDDFRRQAYRLGDGSGQRYVISQSNFRKMLVSLPSIDEQVAIGELLAGHSRAVADYVAQLTALRQEKAALMQQLLTGKRRVKLSESEAA